uniref:ENT domain-containing protein n=2 Tax=Meloidogyne floridensis TaxID=298350 RepID=A0A915NIE0_9BILA
MDNFQFILLLTCFGLSLCNHTDSFCSSPDFDFDCGVGELRSRCISSQWTCDYIFDCSTGAVFSETKISRISNLKFYLNSFVPTWIFQFMQPSTSAVQNLASNILDERDLEEEDAKFLLKALEKQAFEHVLYAFRAQGPLTKYKELILEHLKSALFITDQEFSLNLRVAANNPYLNEIVQKVPPNLTVINRRKAHKARSSHEKQENVIFKLNPSYDNFSEWLAAGLDLTGAELANSRRQQLNKNSTLSDHSTQILREIRRHNRNLSRESCGASEAIAELYQLPKRPFMPERLRKLLRDTEADGAKCW